MVEELKKKGIMYASMYIFLLFFTQTEHILYTVLQLALFRHHICLGNLTLLEHTEILHSF